MGERRCAFRTSTSKNSRVSGIQTNSALVTSPVLSGKSRRERQLKELRREFGVFGQRQDYSPRVSAGWNGVDDRQGQVRVDPPGDRPEAAGGGGLGAGLAWWWSEVVRSVVERRESWDRRYSGRTQDLRRLPNPLPELPGPREASARTGEARASWEAFLRGDPLGVKPGGASLLAAVFRGESWGGAYF